MEQRPAEQTIRRHCADPHRHRTSDIQYHQSTPPINPPPPSSPNHLPSPHQPHQSTPPINTTNQHHQSTPPINTTSQHHQSTPPINTTSQRHQSTPPITNTTRQHHQPHKLSPTTHHGCLARGMAQVRGISSVPTFAGNRCDHCLMLRYYLDHNFVLLLFDERCEMFFF